MLMLIVIIGCGMDQPFSFLDYEKVFSTVPKPSKLALCDRIMRGSFWAILHCPSQWSFAEPRTKTIFSLIVPQS